MVKMTEEEKKGIGKMKIGLGVSVAILVILLISSTWLCTQMTHVRIYVHVDVGAYYYGWYHEGYESHGWNESFDYDPMKDKPFLGYYDSNNENLTKQHVAWADDLGIDFLLLSWSANHSEGIDDNAPLMFQTRQNYGNVKMAICVEPFNRTWDENGTLISDTYNITWIRNYVYDHFCNYSFYYELYDKPLITYILGHGGGGLSDNLTDSSPDDHFTEIGIGGDEGGGRIGLGKGFPSWIKMWRYTSRTPECPYKKAPYSDRCYVVCPRYDDWAKRTRNITKDGTYSEGLYKNDWEEAVKFAENGEIDVIMICTFNEYHERTQIEPTFDATSFHWNPFYIYNLTKKYISELKNLIFDLSEKYVVLQSELNCVRNLMCVLIATTVILIATTVYFARRKPKS